MGCNCKYNGKNNKNQTIIKFLKNREILMICPEILIGLSCPRPSAEIFKGRVVEKTGKDVTELYENASNLAMEKLKNYNISLAILQSRSPTCGVNQIYNGEFSGKLIKGSGLFAKTMIATGYNVMDAEDFKWNIIMFSI